MKETQMQGGEIQVREAAAGWHSGEQDCTLK